MEETGIAKKFDYEKKQLQAVAVLENARKAIARNLSGHVNNAYWDWKKCFTNRNWIQDMARGGASLPQGLVFYCV